MNTIRILSSQPWVARLGWTLLHFLWQGLMIFAVYSAARKWLVRSGGPSARYLLACAALAAMLVLPVVTFGLLDSSGSVPVSSRPAGPLPFTGSDAPWNITAVPESVPTAAASIWMARALPWVVAVWFLGAFAFWARLAGGWTVAARMRSRLVRAAEPEWQSALNRLQARLRVSRPVRLLVSGLVEVPTVVGWLRPVVLVPVGALAGLPADHVEALLLHELAHIRRHDYLVNLAQSIAEALLFYHPAVWWVSGQIRAEREQCCDDMAVSAAGGDAFTYASALAGLESCRPAHLETALAANGGSLSDRIARLLGQSRPVARGVSGPGTIVSALVLAATACAVFAQSGDAPKFEVATVKLNTAAERQMIAVSARPGGRLHVENASLRIMMYNAYTLQDYQIIGGPAWIRSDGYDIEAKAGDPNATRDQIFLMLRSLLEERFQLKTHREMRELPVYNLAVSRGGSKLKPTKEGGCLMPTPGQRMPPPAPGQEIVPCGSPMIAMRPGGMLIRGGKVPMPEFVRILSMLMGRPVVDRTGVTEPFDVRLEFTPDESLSGTPLGGPPLNGGPQPPPSLPGAPAPAADPGAPPNILVAIQEQLGLKLEATKGPVEVLVIDHVERPAEN